MEEILHVMRNVARNLAEKVLRQRSIAIVADW